MNISGETLHIDRTLQERSNPVFNTAKATVYQLAMSGDTEATALVSAMGMTQSATQSSSGYRLPREMLLANTLMMETRYRTIMAMALDSGCKTEVDLPYGYTPRGIQITREGMHYVGLDLPAAIEEAQDSILKLVDPDKRHMVRFAGADATNYASDRAALEGVDGPVCVTSEGLMVYLTNSELEALCRTVQRILEEFGGCWLTPDPECSMQFFGILQLLAGPKAMEILKTNQAMFAQKSDVAVGENFLIMKHENPQDFFRKAAEKLASFGMAVERVPIAKHMPQLRQFDRLTLQQAAGYRALHEKVCYWKITLSGNGVKRQWSEEVRDARMEACLENGILKLTLEGRVDSLSAPQVLGLYERGKESALLEGVHVDCGKLSYISSAGLRVLLIMQKAHPGQVVLRHVGKSVMEILDTTGFSDILTIETETAEV